jgi:hypothetical protein
MNHRRLLIIILCFVLGGHTLVRAQDMDIELAKLTEDLAAKIKEHGNKKITVLDLTDLQGGSSELGKYVAEQLTVDFAMTNRDFSVLDRANRKSILEEHKLATSGLIDPATAKKLGLFAGVDALIVGNVVHIGANITITAKIITTETSEIVGAAKTKFKSDDTVQQLLAQPTTESKAVGSEAVPQEDKAKVVKTFEDLRVEVRSLHIADGGGFILTMVLTNQNPKKSIWVALSSGTGIYPNGNITDSNGFRFMADRVGLSGIPCSSYGPYQQGGFSPAQEIQPNDSISATVKFIPFDGRSRPTAGVCNLQIEFLLGHNLASVSPIVRVKNLVSKIETD